MKYLSLFFAALLAGAWSLSAFAETTRKPKRPSASGAVTPTPHPKSAPTPAASDSRDATPKPRRKSATSEATPRRAATSTPSAATPKATPVAESDSPATPPETTRDKPATPAPTRAPAATLAPTDLREFAAQPPRVQQLISAALELTKLNLTYTYGSADPAKGGMDCSGTMYHLLRAQGFADVPRDSSGQYSWARKRGPFFAVVGKSADSFEFDDLQPGDLLFWTGTYEVKRDIPVSHVMLYLGTEKKTKKRVMFGASDGRSYGGIQRWGVSVFDFKMPREGNGSEARVDFVGYGRIPDLRAAAPVETASTTPAETTPEAAATEAPAPPTPKPATPPKTGSGAKKKSPTGGSTTKRAKATPRKSD